MVTEELWNNALQLHQGGNLDGARAIYQQIARDNPADSRPLFVLGKLAAGAKQSLQAIEYFSGASRLTPAWLDPSIELVRVYISEQRFDEADKVLSRVAKDHFHDANFHDVAAEVLESFGDIKASVKASETATQCANSGGSHHLMLGNRSRILGDYARALTAYERAATFDETRIAALVNAAGVHQQHRNFRDALRSYEQLSKEQIDAGDWVYSLAEVLRELHLFDRWVALVAALPLEKLHTATGRRLRTEVAQFQGQFVEAQRSLRAAMQVNRESDLATQEEISHVRLHFEQTAASHRDFYNQFDNDWKKLIPHFEVQQISFDAANDRIANRALRIGYLSPDFRDHVMGRMALAFLSNRDEAAQQVFLYSTATREDAVTSALAKTANRFMRCNNASDESIAARIKADKIDILIDLSGPTAGSRPGVLARKPAPVIITHVGAAGPIGLSAVDYKLTDAICDLPENQEYLIEKLLPMDGCCYPVPKYPLPTLGLTKEELRLEGKTVVGAFYTYMKLSERCVLLWKRVLDEIPNAVLLFSPLDSKLNVAYENIMRAANISAEQFRFIPAGPTEAERLARYRVVDFVLDSMPYGGVNGTLEALYMGVPVVTLTGKHHSERTSTSMLTHLGVTDTIAQSPEEYIEHAKRLATEPAWREEVSTRIRSRWPKFADPVDYARRWEALLRKVAR